MTLNDYQIQAARTMPNLPNDACELNMALGLAGETGELVDKIKKVVFHSHPFDRDAYAAELGDVLWYLAGLATVHGLLLSDVAAGNVAKLRRRYPVGFDSARSIARDTEAEAVAAQMGMAGAVE